MRVLIVNWHDWTHPHAGGAEFHLRELVAQWSAWGHEVTLLVAGERGKPGEEALEGARVLRAGSRKTFNWVLPAAYRRLREEPFDLVIEDLNKIPLYLPLFARRPVLALVHHLFGATAFVETNAAVAGYVWLGERGLAAAYRDVPFVAVSNSTREDLIDRGIPPENVEVAHQGIRFPPAGLAVPRSLHPQFVHLGRLKRYKQVELALRAFARVLPAVPRARLAIAGSGDYTAELVREAGRLGLGDRVTFHGWMDEAEKWRLMAESWGFLYTSPKEGWGLGSVEAQAAGVPVVVSDSPGLRETLVPGRTGFLVPHGDVDALAERLRALASDPLLVERMGAEGRAHAAQFSWERAAQRLLDACERRLRWGRVERELEHASA
ncbi:MAG: glycosyltransferase family 4 protein [Gemmatimonadota bacterium]